MLNFPEWSDLGNVISDSTSVDLWSNMLMEIEKYRWYFDGDVFSEKVPQEASNQEEEIYLFPLAINLVKMLCVAQADSFFGEWKERPVTWVPKIDIVPDDGDREACDLLNAIMDGSNCNSMLWEHELDRNMFGGGAIKISNNPAYPGHIRWSRITRDCYYPIWDPVDPDALLACYFITTMTPEQAKLKYGYETAREYCTRIEKWTQSEYRTYIDDFEVSAFSGNNPWGLVPAVYTPRFRVHKYWGESLVKDVIPAQDELNMRLADIGDVISYNSHPIRWGVDLPSSFNAKNFPIGANSFWDLGRSFGANREPKVGVLEVENATTSQSFEYIKFIYDWTRTASSAPPIAFGEDNGGGQRSGITLEIRMWPLLRAIHRGRGYLTGSLMKAARISATILGQKRYEKITERSLKSIMAGRVIPSYADILPRDEAGTVDEIVKLLSTDPPGISLETSQQRLGRGPGEVDRIRSMLQDKELWKKSSKEEISQKEQNDENSPTD